MALKSGNPQDLCDDVAPFSTDIPRNIYHSIPKARGLSLPLPLRKNPLSSAAILPVKPCLHPGRAMGPQTCAKSANETHENVHARSISVLWVYGHDSFASLQAVILSLEPVSECRIIEG